MNRSTWRHQAADRPCPRLLQQALLRVDRPWLPEAPGYSMYVRPMAFSSTGSLGITAPTRTTLMVLLSPAGPYFETGARRSYPNAPHVCWLGCLRACMRSPQRQPAARAGRGS